ncbi:POB3 [Ecytonucleospora hepatopenaei]|uniref:POB3 n=1 Tax=Ecytonucleospora hepatopenaei TaxID=646526 RepID=A0A1W0E4W1_9MICR|nr:POB3 [Ecytonucleospora hepatopenaei]
MYLTTEGETYLVVKLDNPILQGQTRYDSMVFSLDKKDIEVSAKDKRLKDYYTGTQDEVVVEIFEKMLGVEARQAMFFVKCNNKVNNGVLFFMESGLQFLTKNMYVEKRNIVLVEFQRLNVPAIQARTFDMSVHADKVYTFSSISKDVFPSIEDYFGKDGIKMVSEVMEEYSEPSNEESEDDSNLSDIIADTDEDD